MRQTETDRDRQRDSEKDRDRQRKQTDRQTDRQTEQVQAYPGSINTFITIRHAIRTIKYVKSYASLVAGA